MSDDARLEIARAIIRLADDRKARGYPVWTPARDAGIPRDKV